MNKTTKNTASPSSPKNTERKKLREEQSEKHKERTRSLMNCCVRWPEYLWFSKEQKGISRSTYKGE